MGNIMFKREEKKKASSVESGDFNRTYYSHPYILLQ